MRVRLRVATMRRSLASAPMRLALLLAGFAAIVLAAYRPAPAPAAVAPLGAASADSSEWVNLQVLPDTISRDALFGVMRGFTDALGVRCSFCHVRNGEVWNYASDDKGHKTVARGMMRMTWQINQEILPAMDGIGEHGTPTVTCFTCHRGAAHPATAAEAAPHDHH